MRMSMPLLAAALLAAPAAGTVLAQDPAPATTPPLPEGYVLVQEDVLAAFVTAPGEYLHKARDEYIVTDLKGSADNIRRCAWFLKLIAGASTRQGKKALMASAENLEKLAANVEDNRVKTLQELDDSFAAAEYALARHHYLKAEESAGKLTARLGREIKAAAVHFEEALSWSGRKLETVPKSLVEDAKTLAERLIRGTAGAGEKISDKVSSLGREIERLGSDLLPGKKEAPLPLKTPASEEAVR